MKNEHVVPDYWVMLKSSITCLLLALSGYVLIKMIQTVFWLPGYLEQNQRRLEEMAAKYALEMEKDEKNKCITNDDKSNEADSKEEKDKHKKEGPDKEGAKNVDSSERKKDK